MSAVTDLEAEGPLAELVRRLRGSRKRVRLTTPDGDEAFVISREDLDELGAVSGRRPGYGGVR